MKKTATIIAVLTVFSALAQDPEARQVICAVPSAWNGAYTVETSSSCTHYVEVRSGVFASARRGCFEAFTTHTLLVEDSEMRAQVDALVDEQKSICFIGKYSGREMKLTVDEMMEEDRLPLE